MRVFALSDVHVDYGANAQWIADLSREAFRDDILILAGDVSDDIRLLGQCLSSLAGRFRKLLFVPGNHDLWVARHDPGLTSLDKFDRVLRVAAECGAETAPHVEDGLAIVPLFSWYDYSFGVPGEALRGAWADYFACRWPDGMGATEVTAHFLARNPPRPLVAADATIITFSHFLPRGDLLPVRVLPNGVDLHPVLGTCRLDAQLRAIGAAIHAYGHSHVDRRLEIGGITYVNSALGYPRETGYASRTLRCLYEG